MSLTEAQLEEVKARAARLEEARVVYTGRPVVFVDNYRVHHIALINQVWNIDDDGKPNYVNLVHISKDSAKSDQYGRQIERPTSVPVLDMNANAAGRYFYFFTNLEEE